MVEEKMMDFEKLYQENFKAIKEGQVVKGKIISIGLKEVMIDIGYKSEGIIPLMEFSRNELEVGREVDVYVESVENDAGMLTLSKEKAAKVQGWDKIGRNFREGDLVEGTIRRKIKGGYLVDVLGIEGFLPVSLSSFRNMSDNEIMNKQFKFKMVKMNNLRHSVIISRKDAVYKEKEESREKLWTSLKIGDIKNGLVKSVTDFGAFIDLGGVDGLLHITDMSWSKISHPSEAVAVGDRIEVMVLNLDRKEGKVSLGLKQRLQDPWLEIANKHLVGSKVKGKVVNILPYGVFVELEKGIEGLIHVSEISWAKRVTNLQSIFAVGDILEVQILSIDKDARRISLSVKQLEVNPWLEAEAKYPAGSKVSGKVRGFTDYGAFVELDNNLEGMIHVSDMSWTKRVAHPQDVLKKGQKVEVTVLSVDGQNRRISLGLKQLEPNPWAEIAKKYPLDTVIETQVVQQASFGVFVKIDDNLEGLIYASEIDKEIADKLKPSDVIKAKVIKVDVEQAKIGLSAKI
ncbi:MAG: 30S ribosomal protein S1 [Candidatus Omnitrophota bacterium]|nr:30S ribosomal protein S1 [Candidatus Omnitrophota bacterium]